MVLLIPNMAPEAKLYGRMTFWLDTGCLMYESANSFHESEETILLSGFSHTYQYYWVDEGAFMEKAKKLIREGIYPGCPVGDLTDAELSVSPEPEDSGTAWEPQLSAYLNSLEWTEEHEVYMLTDTDTPERLVVW